MPEDIVNEEMMKRIRLYVNEDPDSVIGIPFPSGEETTRKSMLEEIEAGTSSGKLFYEALVEIIKKRDEAGIKPNYDL